MLIECCLLLAILQAYTPVAVDLIAAENYQPWYSAPLFL